MTPIDKKSQCAILSYMNIKQTTIYKVDFKKLAKKKELSIREVAKRAGVSYEHLIRCSNGFITMSEKHWIKIREILKWNSARNVKIY